MSQHFTRTRGWPTRLVIAGTVALATASSALFLSHRPATKLSVSVGARTPVSENSMAPEAPKQVAGAAAREYVQETKDGQSLMQAVTAARFGLKQQESDPITGKSGPGYLGMSHDQNLNAWFDETGATIRPTGSEKERTEAWQLGLRLRTYGYGSQMQAAPPIVAHNVNGTRIEYQRADCQLPTSNCRFEEKAMAAFRSSQSPSETFRESQFASNSLFPSAISNRQSPITEWYENRSEGIEQGFTINERPMRSGEVAADERLRLSLGVSGNLRARGNDAGQSIELVDAKGRSAISYSKLTVMDAEGRQLQARMEARADGREIALLVDDHNAAYPIVIDPIVASLEKKLADGYTPHAEARFGFAVAIDGDRAIVGSWRDYADSGDVYFFNRTGATWSSFVLHFTQDISGGQCGFSVAISSNRYVWGCPGANSGTGRAFFYLGSESSPSEIYRPADDRKLGDQFGYSVAIGGTDIVVGAPYSEYNSKPRAGLTYQFGANSDGSVGYKGILLAGNEANSQLGTAVAISDRNCIVSEPGAGAGKALVLNLNPVSVDDFIVFLLQASDGEVGDNFGNSVAISGKTAVVGAWGDDDVATDAGAAYVFVRGSNNWSQQQKLRADDGRQDDHFSEHAVAIEGNTIVVGAYSWDLAVNGDNAGAAYIFTRSGTVWTRETALFGESAQNFGIGIGLSGNSVLVGARGADAQGIARAGAAFVYRLDCTAPHATKALASTGSGTSSNMSLCPGSGVVISSYVSNEAGASLSRQWCKDGVPIPGPNARGNDYTVNNVSASDAGRYDVVVSNACGSEISTPFILSVATFSISPTSGNFGAGGSDGSINVTSTGDCTYTAVPSASWIKITSNESGPPKNIGFHVDPNPGPNQRTGTITIADQTFTVAQDGLNCSYSIAPSAQNFSADGNTSSVNVTATTGCAWAAVSNDNWLTITSGSNGTAIGAVNYSVAANTGPARTGTLTVAGQTVTVTQANGCTYALNPTAQTFPASIAAGAVNVTTVAGCAWTALSNASFISITSNNSGTGNGTVNYSVGANTSSSSRASTLTIAGQTFTITQDGAIATTPAVQFSAASYNIGEGDQRVTLNVTRSGDAGSAASVSFATSDSAGAQNCNVITGVASSRCDYERGIGTVKFAAGETSKAVSVFIIDDSYLEGTETFSVSLSNPSGTSLGAQSTTNVVITDNENANGINPIDTAGFFVRLHYLDFFAREPDSGGLNFWTNEITSCGGNQQCVDNKRVNVSAAFYLSIEFQQTGYLVERIYKTAYGNASGTSTFGGSHQLSVPVVRLNEFLPDTQEIGQGVIVGQTGWEQLLENNKQAFTAGFVQRGRFTSAYPNSMTSAQFVDALNTNAGNPLSQSERDQLIGDLIAGAKTRAQAVRAVAEDSDLISAESNRAFVLMQFFGYLRRNPNDPQDTDYTGYDFWLTKLNQFNGNFVNAEMVKAFISSAEYRQRFGP